MRSLSQLNTRGQTTLNYTDNRAAQVVFDRTVPISQTQNVFSTGTVPVLPGIEILEIIQPNVVNVYYEIDVSDVSGATVSWASPSGTVVISNPSTGIYRASNIDTLADWLSVRSPTINLPSGYTNEFSYTATIYYEPSLSKVSTVGVVFKTALTAQSSLTAQLTGVTKNQVTMQSQFSQTVSVIKIKYGNAVLSSVAGLTARAVVSGKLRSTITSTSSVIARPNAIFSPTRSINAVSSLNASSKIFKGFNLSVSSQFTMSTFINENSYSATELIDDITDTDANFGNVMYADAFGQDLVVTLPTKGYSYIFNRSGSVWSQQQRLSTSGSSISISTALSPNELALGKSGSIDIYTRSGSTWSFSSTINPPGGAGTDATFGQYLRYTQRNATGFDRLIYKRSISGNDLLESDSRPSGTDLSTAAGDTTVDSQYSFAGSFYSPNATGMLIYYYKSPADYIDINFTRENTTSLQEEFRIYKTGSYPGIPNIWNQNWGGDTNGVSVTIGGYYSGNNYYAAVGLYQDNASNASPGQVLILVNDTTIVGNLVSPDSQTNDLFGKALAMDAAGSTLVVSAPGSTSYKGSAVYVYKRTGSAGSASWSLSDIIRCENNATNESFGETLAISQDGQYIFVGSPNKNGGQGSVYVYSKI